MGDRQFKTPYPGYDVLQKWDSPSWNDITRQVVRQRLECVPSRQFFTQDEWDLLEAVCNRIIPQPDRGEFAIPLVPWIDQRLSRGEGEGYRYADMPPGDVAWRKGLKGIEQESRRLFQSGFAELQAEQQDEVLRTVQRGDVEGDAWEGLSVSRFFSGLLLKEVVGIYYSHPAAWSEIGFGGPASPRGYVRLGMDQADSWEAEEGLPGDPQR